MDKFKNIPPGEILLKEFLIPLSISQYRLAKDLDVPQTRISEIVKGNRRITADTAVRLSAYFGNSSKFGLVFKIIMILNLILKPKKMSIRFFTT